MSPICENIKKARKAFGKSQQEMADLLNVKRSTYAKWELSTIPDVLSLIEIGRVLSVDWTSLVKDTITGEPIKPGGKTDIQQIKENTESILNEIKKMKLKQKK